LEIPVEIKFDVQLEHAASNSIVPMALIFNELMSNSLKHAFKGQAAGEIKVFAVRDEKDDVEFIYEDNGTWALPAKDDSFGLELIDALTEQLGGEVIRSTENGTRYTFMFYSQEKSN
jgi:two-component sensor histidine kinase